MKVNQQGTKAAAATGIAITDSLRVGGQTVTFDRPFLLLLEDTATHTPLFLARDRRPHDAVRRLVAAASCRVGFGAAGR